MSALPDYDAAIRKAGWVLGTFGSAVKWWNPKDDDGSRYCDTPRAARYICEDHPGILEAGHNGQ